MTNICAQDFRNAYEKFYAQVRRYLWPYSVLLDLAELETNIYTAFLDIEQLKISLSKLNSSMQEVLKEDKLVAKSFNNLIELSEIASPSIYMMLPRVAETRPLNMKQLKTISDDNMEDDEHENI